MDMVSFVAGFAAGAVLIINLCWGCLAAERYKTKADLLRIEVERQRIKNDRIAVVYERELFEQLKRFEKKDWPPEIDIDGEQLEELLGDEDPEL